MHIIIDLHWEIIKTSKLDFRRYEKREILNSNNTKSKNHVLLQNEYEADCDLTGSLNSNAVFFTLKFHPATQYALQ